MDNRITVHGLNVKETATGDSDKLITLVTNELGRITVVGKGVKSLKSRNMVATQQFAFSTYVLKKYKNYYYVEETELIECFYGIRENLDKLALAAYLCDVCGDVTMENEPEPEILRLTLNSLFALSDLDMTPGHIKAGFEFRMASLCGFCPDLSSCCLCNCDNGDNLYLDVMNGHLICYDCKPQAEKEAIVTGDETARIYYKLNSDILNALRFIVNSGSKQFLNYKISDKNEKQLEIYTEGYLINHLEHPFHTLNFYRAILL